MEKWKTIEGYERYMISSMGRIWSKTRVVSTSNKKHKTIKKGQFLKTRINDNGYETVNLKPDDNKKKIKTLRVHRLMAKAFIPNPNNLDIINHINYKRDDNRLENLEWTTSSKNNKHRWKGNNTEKDREKAREIGKINGKKNRFISLSKKLEIIEEYNKGEMNQKELSIKHNISKTVISLIVNKKYFTEDDIDAMDEYETSRK